MSAAQAQKIVHLTVETLLSLRSDEHFSLFLKKNLKLAEDVGVQEPSLPRHRRVPLRFEIGDSQSSHNFPGCVEDRFRAIYFEAIDVLTSCMKERFTQSDFQMYATLEQVLLKGACGGHCDEELAEISSLYGPDFNFTNLKTQLETLAIQVKTASRQ